jgi:AraC-like DNA-binding protein
VFSYLTGQSAKINDAFRKLKYFQESFTALRFLIHPHVMHISREDKGSLPLAGSKEHTHRTFEYSVILSGTMRYSINGHTSNLAAGDAVIIPADVPHLWQTLDDAAIFGFMLFISSHGDGARQKMNELRKAAARYKYRIKNFVAVHELLRTIMEEALKQASGFDEKIQCYSHVAYVELLRKLLPNASYASEPLRLPPQRDNATASIVDQTYVYIQDNLTKKISIRDISASLGVSIRRLTGAFKQTNGVSVNQFIINTRLQQASSLLTKTDRSLNDIATAVGYEDSNYFCRVFKRRMGMTPSEFRRKS